MDDYKNLCIEIGSVISNTLTLRQQLVQVINEEKPNAIEGIVSLIVLAAGHAKEVNFKKDSFIYLCNMLYDGITILKDSAEDIIILSDGQNN